MIDIYICSQHKRERRKMKKKKLRITEKQIRIQTLAYSDSSTYVQLY